MKKLWSVLLLVVLMGAVACAPNEAEPASVSAITVTISIAGLDAQAILPETDVHTTSGENVLSVLRLLADEADIDVQISQRSFGDYVTGIDGLSAGSNGETSGWIYKVNDESPNVGMDGYNLVGGEKIEVIYITSF